MIATLYIMPAAAIVIFAGLSGYKFTKDRREIHNLDIAQNLKLKDKKHKKHMLELLVVIVGCSYLPVMLYAFLEHLQVTGINSLGLPSPGISYIIHLALTLLRTIGCLKVKFFREKLLFTDEGERIDRVARERVSLTIISYWDL